VGASPDPVEENKAFKEKYGLSMDLVSDTDRSLPKAISEEKRWAALVEGGSVVKLWPTVDPAKGPQEILDELAKAPAAATKPTTKDPAAPATKDLGFKPSEKDPANPGIDFDKMDDPWSKRKAGVVHSTSGGN